MPSPNSAPISVSPEIENAISPAPELQRQPVRIERDRRAAALPVGRAIDAGGRAAVCVAQAVRGLEQPRAECLHAGCDGVDPDSLEVPEADLDRGNADVIAGPVLE